MSPINYLWYPVLPIGMLSSILGEPGIAKTYLLVDVAARVSTGQPLPIYGKPTETVGKGWVIYITSEGVPDKILKPRLHAAGANMDEVTVIKGVFTGDSSKFQLLDIQTHLPALQNMILRERKAAQRDCALVVIDPIASFVSARTNLNDMAQTRQALDSIARFAEEANISVVVAIHPNKDETKKLMSRASGSVQMSAAVKSAWVVVGPKEDDPPNLRYFAPYKINIAPFDRQETLPFVLEDASFEHDENSFEVAKYRNESLARVDIERMVNPRANEGINMASKARALLKEQLKDGPKSGNDLIRMGEDAGIGSATMYKAKTDLGISDAPAGCGRPWMWFFPTEESLLHQYLISSVYIYYLTLSNTIQHYLILSHRVRQSQILRHTRKTSNTERRGIKPRFRIGPQMTSILPDTIGPTTGLLVHGSSGENGPKNGIVSTFLSCLKVCGKSELLQINKLQTMRNTLKTGEKDDEQ